MNFLSFLFWLSAVWCAYAEEVPEKYPCLSARMNLLFIRAEQDGGA